MKRKTIIKKAINFRRVAAIFAAFFTRNLCSHLADGL